MNYTADQIFEISTAVRCGLSVAGLKAVPAEERKKWRELALQRLEGPLKSLGERERQVILESISLSDHPEELAERARKRYYSHSEKERGRRPAGQRMALNDMLSQSQHFSYAQREAVDQQLKSRGLPSLRSLEISLKRKHERILRRGSIRNDEEYYVVKEVLSDVSFEITDSDRARFEHMFGDYECRKGKR